MYSTTYLAEIVKVVSVIALARGIELDQQVILEIIGAIGLIIAQVYTLYKRFQLGGVNAFGIRK